ncbi:predicted glycosyltransferase [Chthonomonas calidirosea]|uniref:Predicted glycosyltransferase n=1 Tax=Chthonomonas calidirosea (strain DSM 23976 / ICMP 18418 / T49) TaxID=1303518 RepID=S0EWG6_CHTCT|nr:PilZ domain-containing protein [Chthonomonas calidirosea]CCW36236.1 Predicted glycosyltransferase [Chthonomonas calidirosea T49]CEK17931.1 predicted glycosyltransferase [Chthonomonas calidirosea]
MAAFWAAIVGALSVTLIGLWQSSIRYYTWRRLKRRSEGMMVSAELLWQTNNPCLVLRPPGEIGAEPICIPATLWAVKRYHLYFLSDLDKGCLPETAVEWLQKGNLLFVEMTGEAAIYRAEVRLCGIRSHAQGLLIKTTRPFWAVRIQRRQYARVAVALPIVLERMEETSVHQIAEEVVKPSERSDRQTQRQRFDAVLCDLSAGGFRAELLCEGSPQAAAMLSELLAPQTMVTVHLPIIGLEKARLRARVLTCDRILARCGLGVRIACSFLAPEPWEQEEIMHFVFQKQREELQRRRPSRFV